MQLINLLQGPLILQASISGWRIFIFPVKDGAVLWFLLV